MAGSAQERPSADEPLAYRQQRFSRSEAALQLLDANHDGQIDATEVQGPRAHYAARLLEKTGIPPNFPIAVSQLRAGLLDYYHLTADQVPPPVTATAVAARPATPTSGAATLAASSSATPQLVPGFGVAGQLPVPPGFGVAAVTPATGTALIRTAAYARSTAPAVTAVATAAAAGAPPLDDRIRQYAQSLVRQYDTNHNGVLERDEWKNMSGDWQAADTNGDGILTVDEIANYLTRRSRKGGYGAAGSAATASPPSTWKSYAADAARGRASSTDPLHRGARFLTPAERLPKGLPDWFLAKDTNGDGQISMSEFSQSWNEATAKEFSSYDLNGDGVITAEEVMAKIAADNAAGPTNDRSTAASPVRPPAVGAAGVATVGSSGTLSVTGTERISHHKHRSEPKTTE